MKRLFLFVLLFIFFLPKIFSQTSRHSHAEKRYTGERFDGYGIALDKKNQPKKRRSQSNLGNGAYESQASNRNFDKSKKKKRSNFKGRKKKKGCNCPGH